MGLSRGKPPPLADVDLWRLKHVATSPGKTGWLEARLLAEPDWIDTHFVPGQGGMPHLDANCPWCHGNAKPRSYCYMPVIRLKLQSDRPVWGRSVLELPAEVAGLLPALGRGSVIEVLRQADKSYRARVKEIDRALVEATLIPPFDLLEVLLRYWRLKREDLEAGPQEKPDTIRFPGRKIG